ncbi:MauE/DoxX family redox-associated membrane protein [Streptomyces sp. NPDC057682]|uniref:MauE/DoxX family redox-associated membrane protein n=1 Tax=unclassified Streptomyces TaxID=2593676 RepID=UPI003654F49B
MDYAVLTVRWALAGIFLVSALAKVRAFPDTLEMVRPLLTRAGRALGRVRKAPPGPGTSGRGFARRFTRPAALLLVTAEAATGLALLGPRQTAGPGLAAAAVLTAGFTALAVLATVARTEVRCACFGRPTARLGRRHVVRNGFLLALACLGCWGPGAAGVLSAAVPALVVCATAAVVVTAVTAFYDDIVDLLKIS